MAVFIPRNRLGDRAQKQHESRLTQRIEGMQQFKALRSKLAEAKEERVGQLKEKFEGNAEVQNWRTKTDEEKKRDAIERMVPTTKQVTEGRTGKECSYEDARKVAEDIAYKADKKKALKEE